MLPLNTFLRRLTDGHVLRQERSVNADCRPCGFAPRIRRNAPRKTCPLALRQNPIRGNVLVSGRNDKVFLREAGEAMVYVNKVVNQIFNHVLDQFTLGICGAVS